jgi:hypothetical protein
VQIQFERLGIQTADLRQQISNARRAFLFTSPCYYFVSSPIMPLGSATPLRIDSETLRKTSGVLLMGEPDLRDLFHGGFGSFWRLSAVLVFEQGYERIHRFFLDDRLMRTL